MVSSIVDRATSDMLIGPDWAMNIEICDMLNHDPVQAKDVVKGIKKRLGNKNPKVQLLALTLLETVIKNCGDVVHMHVAERDVLHEMVKIVKKKPDFHVKEKILVLIDTWQEAFGGSRARYPQYYAAYQELLRAGAVFPQRSERSAPVFTPPQSQPLTSYPQNMRNPEYQQEAAESSAESEFPSLSLTEIQNARGIMDVLAEMLNAIDPGNKEGLGQEVIVDLVEQCRTYKQRVVHLVNSSSDESLLCQGLALNDELQRLLAKHEAIASGRSVPEEKSNTEPVRSLTHVGGPLIETGDKGKQLIDRSTTSATTSGMQQPSLHSPTTTNASVAPPARLDPKVDLLSGDDYKSPTIENPLALVPLEEPPQASSSASQQNALVLADLYSQNYNTRGASNNQPSYPSGQTYPSTLQLQLQQNLQSPLPNLYPNGSEPTSDLPHYPQSNPSQAAHPAWNDQIAQQQQHPPPHSSYGTQSSGSLPPPPWEAQSVDIIGPSGITQVPLTPPQPFPSPSGNGFGMHGQPVISGHLPGTQFVGSYPPQAAAHLPYPQPVQVGPMAPLYHPQQMYPDEIGGFGYSQQAENQLLQQQMYGLSMRDDSVLRNSSHQASVSQSYLPTVKPSKPEDKLFGDLVDMAKVKQTKPTPGRRGGSL